MTKKPFISKGAVCCGSVVVVVVLLLLLLIEGRQRRVDGPLCVVCMSRRQRRHVVWVVLSYGTSSPSLVPDRGTLQSVLSARQQCAR